jgi:hypothetical protein
MTLKSHIYTYRQKTRICILLKYKYSFKYYMFLNVYKLSWRFLVEQWNGICLPLENSHVNWIHTNFLLGKKNIVFSVINWNLFSAKQYIVKLTLSITRSLVGKLQINMKLLVNTVELQHSTVVFNNSPQKHLMQEKKYF